MTYSRIEEPQQLPPPGPLSARAREQADLDFKAFADRREPWEHAKDIAAFANALGGVILVGARVDADQLLYPGVRGQTVADVMAIYEEAAKLCSPTPVVNPIPVEQSAGTTVVAINVEPFLDQAVGAPGSTRAANGGGCIQEGSWRFPIRRASQTEWIKPEALPLYLNREIRRAVLMLSKIPMGVGREVTVHYHRPREVDGRHWDGIVQITEMRLEVEDVSFEKNRVRFVERGSWELYFNVPLLDVLDVWESQPGRWEVLVAGVIRRKRGEQHDSLHYAPLPRQPR